MLLRSRSASRSLSLPHIQTLRRPHLPSRQPSPHLADTPTAGRRLLVTQHKLAPWRPKTTPTPLGCVVAHRPLATAIDDSMRPDEIPFVDHLHAHSLPNSYMQPPSHLPVYHLRTFDPASTLHVKVQNDILPRARVSSTGVPGGVDEMVSVFDACLQVNHLERAAHVLKRFRTLGNLPYSDLVALHNMYLRAGIDACLDQPELKWAQSLHHWFEIEIRGNELPFTSETIACMLKISLLSSQGARLNRLVTRYFDMLPSYSTWDLLDSGILNQQDFGTIATICEPVSEVVVDAFDSTMTDNQTEEISSAQATATESLENKSTSIPEVRPVPQKGLGLKTLRGILSFFDQIEGQDLSKLSIDERREIQSRLEHDCVEAAVSRWRDENQALAKMGRSTAMSKPALNSQLYDWHLNLESKLRKEFSLFDESEEKEKKSTEDIDRCQYAPFMKQSNPTRLAAVTIMGVLSCITHNGADKGVPLSTLLTSLAKIVEEDIRLLVRLKNKQNRKESFLQARRQRMSKPPGPNVSNTTESNENSPATPNPQVINVPVYDNTSWPALIKAKVGAQLLSALLDTAKIKVVRNHPETGELVSQTQPALARTSVHRKGKKIGIIVPNRVLVDLMKKEPRGDYLARHLPMLVEPQPWTKFEQGGFLEYPSQLVRIKNGERDQRIYADAAFERGDLDQVSKGLDVLGRTAWQVNKSVFKVMLEAWNTGEGIANIPPLDPKIPIPEEPVSSDDPMVRKQWLKLVKLAENEKSGLHSERCFMNFQLDIARAFKDQSFYFPHNMDFRGRAYPIPAYLNHMGADHVRGLLRFAKGRELGENGLRWLKVQLANVFGFDKASLDEREKFATDHITEIFDSATNPLTGQRWWLKAEDPWQCLAACFELKAALESPDPSKFVSRLPVHQDGTCNGLQHYAALGGDRWGAEQVNLLPGDRPADVYSAVADLVKAGIKEDLAANNFMAKAVDGKITRKVVKQTVMTNVYGVTFIGAKAQVLKQIDAAYPNIESETGVPSTVLASYIATKIFRALSTMFRGAHDIQYWLGECAGRVCRALTPEQLERVAAGAAGDQSPPQKAKRSRAVLRKPKAIDPLEDLLNQFRSTIVWTTPLRMPIVQPYRKSTNRVISTCLQDLTLQVPERSDPVNRRKQLQAFPPNFIHSLDASHMLLSALECDSLGLSFAAVHDSFWTHAADVDVMNRVLRDAFIRIHSEDVIGRLASEFNARYGGSLYLAKVARSTDVEREISAHRRGNRQNMREELLEERERQRLLASEDPADILKGKEMVTPASIYEKMSSSEVLLPIDGLDEPDMDDASADLDIAVGSTENPSKVQELMKVSHFEATLKKMTAATESQSDSGRKPVEYISVWLPLTFPPIPAKGDFDVKQLKSSKYFFS
ncbi:DNA-directed RNA polymerase [Xylaria bambusicola]|uniref:DNA-directed RNA polymerase n=1 Tax=Xylaria bambusicola TaxID=326684 RepID=UPI00200816D6|nr:DNA-directed RNA polymerase [Xylaria bambusicola]KAI0516874.1 DNA-directed RNA polymerase [Xylaria bambusicola]